MLRRTLLGVALAFTVCRIASASEKPANIAITPASREGLIIVKATPIAVDFTIGLSRLDPVGEGDSAAGGRSVDILVREEAVTGDYTIRQVGPGKFVTDAYFVRVVKPGSYVLRELVQQGSWGLCFEGATVQFTVKPGEALYLGRFDSAPALGALQRNVLSSADRVEHRGGVSHFAAHGTQPHFFPIDDEDLAGARAFVAKSMPKTSAVPEAATYTPATFRSVSRRRCGGDFSPKPALGVTGTTGL